MQNYQEIPWWEKGRVKTKTVKIRNVYVKYIFICEKLELTLTIRQDKSFKFYSNDKQMHLISTKTWKVGRDSDWSQLIVTENICKEARIKDRHKMNRLSFKLY